MMKQVLFTCLLILGLLESTCAFAVLNIDTESLHLQFSEQGDLLRVESCFPVCGEEGAKTRVLSSEQGMLVFKDGDSPPLLLESTHENDSTLLVFSEPEGRSGRRWKIPDNGWVLSVESIGAEQAELMSGEDFRPAPSSGFGYLLEQSRYLFFDGTNVTIMGLDEEEYVSREVAGWFGFRNRFWTAMILPDAQLPVNANSGETVNDAKISIRLDGENRQQMKLYLGPVEPVALKQAAPELENLMYSGLWFWLRWICQALFYLLGGIFVIVPHWGLAVMVLSLVVGVLMRPLSRIADRLQDQVHEIDARLAPKLAAIKKDNKGAEQSEKIITMYKEEGVHPLYSLKSLMGVFVVIPVFIGAFDMLAENIHLSGASFLWIADLSHPDSFLLLPFTLPFFGGYLNLLPFIMTGFSFVASKLHAHPAMDAAQQRKQSRNLVLMSVAFLVLFYTFPAGMVLYWTTNNLISVIKILWKKRKVGAELKQ